MRFLLFALSISMLAGCASQNPKPRYLSYRELPPAAVRQIETMREGYDSLDTAKLPTL